MCILARDCLVYFSSQLSVSHYLPSDFWARQTYLRQTWSGRSRSGLVLHSGKNPHGRWGWKCQNLVAGGESQCVCSDCCRAIISKTVFQSNITMGVKFTLLWICQIIGFGPLSRPWWNKKTNSKTTKNKTTITIGAKTGRLMSLWLKTLFN